MSSTLQSASQADIPAWIPEGYVLLSGPDGKNYIVPDFFVHALDHNLDSYRKKEDLKIERAAGTVSSFISVHFSSKPNLLLIKDRKFNSSTFGVIGEGKIMAPTAPVSSAELYLHCR
jgi:hypothetical protein